MTEKRFTMDNPNDWGFPITDNKTGTVYNCNSNIWMKELVGVLNALNDENEQLKSENIQLTVDNKELKCTNNELYQENEQLKQQIKKLEAQLYKVEDGVCDICNNMYLVQQGRYFVSKCKKGHDECSKMDLDYCDDFELKGDVE